MLTILAASTPQTPNVTALCRNLEMDRKAGLRVLYAMRRAGLLGLLAEDAAASASRSGSSASCIDAGAFRKHN